MDLDKHMKGALGGNVRKSLKKNLVMNTLLTVANLLFPLITYTHVARVLTPVGTGKVAFVQANLACFGYIATLGVPTYGLRECAKIRADRQLLSHTAQELFLINLFSTIVACFLLIASVILIPQFRSHRRLFAIMGMSLMLTPIGMEWLYKALEEYSFLTCVLLAFKCIAVGLTFFLIRTSDDFHLYGFLTVFASGATSLCCGLRVHRYISFRKTRAYCFKKHLKPIAFLAATSLMITIYAHFDVSMLGFLRGEYEVGLYNAALKIKNVIMSAGIATTAVFIPRIAAYGKEKREAEISRLVVKSMQVSLLTVLPLMVFVLLHVRPTLMLVCGLDYLEADSTLQLLIFCAIPQSLANIFGNQLLIPLGQEKRFTQSVFAGMFINLLFNLMLIPHYGANGAVLGTIATEWWNVFWMSGGVKRYRSILLKDICYSQYGLSVCLAVAVSWCVERLLQVQFIALRMVAVGSVFLTVYYFVLFFQKESIICALLSQVKKLASSLLKRKDYARKR